MYLLWKDFESNFNTKTYRISVKDDCVFFVFFVKILHKLVIENILQLNHW